MLGRQPRHTMAPGLDFVDLPSLSAAVHQCRKCPLGHSRTRAVPGVGPADARIMIVGEAPGQNEDQQGEPFVGAAGKLLDQLLNGIGLSRADVFITNILKCRPPRSATSRGRGLLTVSRAAAAPDQAGSRPATRSPRPGTAAARL